MDGKAAAKCAGHTYILEFHQGPTQFRILDWNTRDLVAADIDVAVHGKKTVHSRS
jgi:hypothetical protein